MKCLAIIGYLLLHAVISHHNILSYKMLDTLSSFVFDIFITIYVGLNFLFDIFTK